MEYMAQVFTERVELYNPDNIFTDLNFFWWDRQNAEGREGSDQNTERIVCMKVSMSRCCFSLILVRWAK
jgi:hypothetical protein